MQTCENVNTRLQEDIERLTAEDMQRQLSGSSNERTSIHTLEEEMGATFRHSRHLSEQLDETVSEDIQMLLQAPDLPEGDLSSQEVRQLIENEHAKTLIVIGKMNTAEKNLRDLRKAVYGTTLTPSPPLVKAESSAMGSRRTFDDEVLGHLENLEHDDNVSSEEYLYNEESSEFEDDRSEIRHSYTPSLSHHSSEDTNENRNLVEELRREIAVLKIQAVVRRIRHINPPINTPLPRLNTIWLVWS